MSPDRRAADLAKKRQYYQEHKDQWRAKWDRIKSDPDALSKSRARSLAYYKGHREACLARMKEHRLAYPEQELAREKRRDPSRRREQRIRERIKHREDYRRRASEWYYKNKDRAIGNVKAYSARIRGAAVCDFTRSEWREQLNYYGGRCGYCGNGVKYLTMDHMWPVSRGGWHTNQNIVPACRECNSRKHDRSMVVALMDGIGVFRGQEKAKCSTGL